MIGNRYSRRYCEDWPVDDDFQVELPLFRGGLLPSGRREHDLAVVRLPGWVRLDGRRQEVLGIVDHRPTPATGRPRLPTAPEE